MAYAVDADVRAVLARDLTDEDGTGASIPDLSVSIADAASEIDARLAGRYTVPFPDGSVPPLVHSLTVNVAAYLVTLTYRQSVDLGVDDPVRLRYQRAQDILKALGDGTMDLPQVPDPDTGGDAPASSGAATVRNAYAGTMFGLEDFDLGYAPSGRRRSDYRVDTW